MTRKSLRTGRFAPTGRISPYSNTRSSFTWIDSGMSATSSKNSVPPSACSNSPFRACSAPVNAPRAWPNSSLSASDGLSDATLTGTNGPSQRWLYWWIARATSSLPVPLSPRIWTHASVGATTAIRLNTS